MKVKYRGDERFFVSNWTDRSVSSLQKWLCSVCFFLNISIGTHMLIYLVQYVIMYAVFSLLIYDFAPAVIFITAGLYYTISLHVTVLNK